MHTPLSITAVLACGAMLAGCAADTRPTDVDGRATAAEIAPQAIVAAAHEELAAACEAAPPNATARIFTTQAPGGHVDVACSTILHVDEPVGRAGEALAEGEEPIGQVQQQIGPISLVGCGLIAIGGPLFANRAICPRGTTAANRADCDSATTFGGVGLSVLCIILPF